MNTAMILQDWETRTGVWCNAELFPVGTELVGRSKLAKISIVSEGDSILIIGGANRFRECTVWGIDIERQIVIVDPSPREDVFNINISQIFLDQNGSGGYKMIAMRHGVSV